LALDDTKNLVRKHLPTRAIHDQGRRHACYESR